MSERPLHEGKLDRAQTLSNVRSKATYTKSDAPIPDAMKLLWEVLRR